MFCPRKRVTFLPCLFLAWHISKVSSICYYPDGTATNSDQPCLSGSEPSWCCGHGFICLDNKMCMATPQQLEADHGLAPYVRGSCTDKTWRDGNCPNFCVNGDAPVNDLLSGGMGMMKCQGTDEQVFYCVDGNMETVDCAAQKNVAVIVSGAKKTP